jgi:hypothetical protein
VSKLFQPRLVTSEIPPGILASPEDDELHLEIRVSRRFTLCVVLSLLFHAILLLAPIRSPLGNTSVANAPVQGPLTVRLGKPVEVATAPEAALPAEPTPEPPRPKKAQIAVEKKPTTRNTVRVPKPKPTPEPDIAQTDMGAMLNATRERRHPQTADNAHENGERAGDSGEPSEDLATANIKNDLKRRTSKHDGTNGIFQILSKGTRTGQFSFRGWQTGSQSNWRETISVDAGPNGNVELAMVRKMIELIRKHYPGDFNWESHRLGRVLVLSARPQDSAELEAFLMREFFEGR